MFQQPTIQPQGKDAVVDQLTSVSRRLRVLEERYSNLDRRIQMSEQNMLNNHRSLNTELKTTASDVSDLKKDYPASAWLNDEQLTQFVKGYMRFALRYFFPFQHSFFHGIVLFRPSSKL